MTKEKVKQQVINLGAPIKETPSGSMSKVEIEYWPHKSTGHFSGCLWKTFLRRTFAAVENIALASHGCNHLDAPCCYTTLSKGEPSCTIDQIPLEWCYSVNGRVQ